MTTAALPLNSKCMRGTCGFFPPSLLLVSSYLTTLAPSGLPGKANTALAPGLSLTSLRTWRRRRTTSNVPLVVWNVCRPREAYSQPYSGSSGSSCRIHLWVLMTNHQHVLQYDWLGDYISCATTIYFSLVVIIKIEGVETVCIAIFLHFKNLHVLFLLELHTFHHASWQLSTCGDDCGEYSAHREHTRRSAHLLLCTPNLHE